MTPIQERIVGPAVVLDPLASWLLTSSMVLSIVAVVGALVLLGRRGRR